MDKRIPMLNALFHSHSRLLEVYHSSNSDNTVLLEFCKLYVAFIKLLKPRDNGRLFDYIFTPKTNLGNKDVLNAHLYAAGKYAATLVKRIKESPQLDLSNELIGVVFDYAKLLSAIEKVYGLPFGNFAGSRNMKVDSYTSYKVAVQIFWAPRHIERSNTLNAYTIFALRQAIELAGKELIGLESILNKDQTVFLYGTQIPWAFITMNQTRPYFSFAFNPSEVQKIFQWSNHFVHTGQNALCYATALALSTIEQLYKLKWFINFHGEKDSNYANEISDYSTLKKDFEDYLKQDQNKPKFAKWAPGPNLAIVTG